MALKGAGTQRGTQGGTQRGWHSKGLKNGDSCFEAGITGLCIIDYIYGLQFRLQPIFVVWYIFRTFNAENDLISKT